VTSAERHPISYADSDGLSIAYQVVGDGERDIVFVPGFVSHLEVMREIPGIDRLLERLAGLGRLIVFDKRGTGLSDRELGSGTLEERMHDLLAVCDAAGVEEADIVGISEGGPLALLFTAAHPHRVRNLVIGGTFVVGPLAGDFPLPEGGRAFAESLLADVARTWGTGDGLRHFIKAPAIGQEALARLERNASTPASALANLRSTMQLDVRGVLSSISVPTCVVHVDGDPLVPEASAEAVVNGIPGATLATLPGDFHVSWYREDMDRYADVIEESLTGAPRATRPALDRVLATVLFVDIVGSTELAAEKGDDAWRRLLTDFGEVSRREIERARGRWVKGTGDGFLAVFDGPGRAIAAAGAVRDTVTTIGLQIRAGIHTGEIELLADDIGGIAVHAASRVADLAADDEIWVSPTVPGLVVGSGIEFAERGEHDLKGIPGEWRLSSVVTA
jgi:class 3 adenylate cyclase